LNRAATAGWQRGWRRRRRWKEEAGGGDGEEEVSSPAVDEGVGASALVVLCSGWLSTNGG